VVGVSDGPEETTGGTIGKKVCVGEGSRVGVRDGIGLEVGGEIGTNS